MDKFIQKIAVQAGQCLLQYYKKNNKKTFKKNLGDFATEADYAAEKIIIQAIQKKYPDHNILAEEAGETNNNSKYTWIIDPLDGTRNFSLGIPMFAVSIALVSGKEVVLGAIYDPIHHELFFAKKNHGSFLNNKKIKTNKSTKIQHLVWGLGAFHDRTNYKQFTKWYCMLSQYSGYFRRLGSAVLNICYISCGRMDNFIIGGVYPWDVAAAGLLVQEAGGIITTVKGTKWNPLAPVQNIIASSNKNLHNKILKAIKL